MRGADVGRLGGGRVERDVGGRLDDAVQAGGAPFVDDGGQDRARGAAVLHGVDQDGVAARQLQPGDHRLRRGQAPPAGLDDRVDDRQRDHVLVGIAIGVLDPRDEQERAPQRDGLLDPDGADAKGAPGEPVPGVEERGEGVLQRDAVLAEEEALGAGAGDRGRLVGGGQIGGRRRRRRLEREPVKSVPAQGQQVGQLADRRKLGVAEQLDGAHPLPLSEIELHVLHEARQVGDDEDRLVLELPHEGQHAGVAGGEQLHRAAAERLELLAQRDEALGPPEQRVGVVLLRLDVDRLVVVLGVDDDRQDQPLRVGAREAGVAVGAPLHRRAHAVAVAEVDVVAHPDLVAVVEDRRAGQREEQAVQELHLAAVVADQRRQAAADAEVDPHLVGRGRRRGTCSRAPRRSPSPASARRGCAGTAPTGSCRGSAASAPGCR